MASKIPDTLVDIGVELGECGLEAAGSYFANPIVGKACRFISKLLRQHFGKKKEQQRLESSSGPSSQSQTDNTCHCRCCHHYSRTGAECSRDIPSQTRRNFRDEVREQKEQEQEDLQLAIQLQVCTFLS